MQNQNAFNPFIHNQPQGAQGAQATNDADNLTDDQVEQLMQMQAVLAKEIGIDVLDNETQQQIISEIGELIMREYMLDCFDATPKEHQDEFKHLIENAEEPEEVNAFIQKYIPNPEVILQKSSKKIVDSYRQNLNPAATTITA